METQYSIIRKAIGRAHKGYVIREQEPLSPYPTYWVEIDWLGFSDTETYPCHQSEHTSFTEAIRTFESLATEHHMTERSL